MSVALFFWIVFLIWIVLGAWRNWPSPGAHSGYDLLLVILVGTLGWHAFGPPVRI